MYLHVDCSIIHIGHDMETAMYLFSPADFPSSCAQSREPRTRAWAQPRGVKAGDGDRSPGRGEQSWYRSLSPGSSSSGKELATTLVLLWAFPPICMKCFPTSQHPLAQFIACQSAAGFHQSVTGSEHSALLFPEHGRTWKQWVQQSRTHSSLSNYCH